MEVDKKKDKKQHSSSSKEHKAHKENRDRSKERHKKKSSKRSKSSESSSNEERHRSQSPDKKNRKKRLHVEQPEKNDTNGGGGGEKLELSIEETNKLREKLGLKPLQIDNKNKEEGEGNNVSAGGNKIYRDEKTDEVFEHIPAKSITATKEETKLREKLDVQREKRQLVDKFRVKGLGESDDEEETAQDWVKKLKAKQEAEKKAKLLEEMDKQFGEAEYVPEKPTTAAAKKQIKDKNYTSNDLSGLRVEHSQDFFKEGQSTILTLKDKNVLDEEDGDALINVNIADEERAAKNVENKKKKAAYKPYEEFDEFGNFQEKSVLDKYDEELDGQKTKSFKLGSGGTYDTSMDKFIEQQNEEYKSRAIKLDVNEFKIAKDYMSKEEQEAFKKPKKIRKKLRKAIKADDLLPLPGEEEEEATSVVARPSASIKKEPKSSELSVEELREIRKNQLNEAEASSSSTKKLTLKDLDLDLNKKTRRRNDSDDEDEENERRSKIDNSDLRLDDDDVYGELHNVLDKVRRKTVTNKINEITKRILEGASTENKHGEEEMEIKTEPLTNYDDLETDDSAITLDSMKEFCRNLGDLPGTAAKFRTVVKKEENDMNLASTSKKMDVDDEEEDEEDEEEQMNYAGDSSDDEGNDIKKKKQQNGDSDDEAQPILDDEPVVDRGLASALALALNKGYLEEEKRSQNARLKAVAAGKEDISAMNYTIEEKSFYDIDDKYKRGHDRYSGPTSEFKEKEGYRPDVNLEYVDEKGHRMNEKEAFRYLSHRFHGKGPGKKKTEKRTNKIKELESMNKMSSVDTPLNTVALLVEKQKKLHQPYVVLSAPKADKAEIPLHKR